MNCTIRSIYFICADIHRFKVLLLHNFVLLCYLIAIISLNFCKFTYFQKLQLSVFISIIAVTTTQQMSTSHINLGRDQPFNVH